MRPSGTMAWSAPRNLVADRAPHSARKPSGLDTNALATPSPATNCSFSAVTRETTVSRNWGARPPWGAAEDIGRGLPMLLRQRYAAVYVSTPIVTEFYLWLVDRHSRWAQEKCQRW